METGAALKSLFTDYFTVLSVTRLAPDDRMVGEWWIVTDLEGNGYGLIK